MIALAAAAGLATPARAGGLAPDLQRDLLANPLSLVPRRVIVQYNQSGVLGSLLAATVGGTLVADLPLVQGAVMLIPQVNLPLLARNSAVKWVSPDRTLFRMGDFDYDVETAGADAVWASQGYRGAGAGIAVLDTGVYGGAADWKRRQSTTSRIIGWKDFVNGRSSPYDDNGHGTHVAGIALGAGTSSGGAITGAAPDASLVAVKVLAGDGSGRVSTVIQGLNWCLQNRGPLRIRVVNLSLGHRPAESRHTDPLCAAVRALVQTGIVVVCSAGNQGKDSTGKTAYGGISCPGNEPAAITVGALNTAATESRVDDTVCSFSSRGPTYYDHETKPDLVAPGNRIVSVRAPGSLFDAAHPQNRYDADPGTPSTVDYFRLSGTSMAAPQVAGTAALMLQANTSLAPNTVKAILMYTAETLGLRHPTGEAFSPVQSLLTQGAGSLNAVGAVETALRVDTTAAAGEWWLTGPLSGQSVIRGYTFPWSGLVLWGHLVVRGEGLLGYNQPAWSSSTTWNDQTTWGQQVTWGDDEVGGGGPPPGEDPPPGGEPPPENPPGEVPPDQVTWGEASIWKDEAIWDDLRTWAVATLLALGE